MYAVPLTAIYKESILQNVKEAIVTVWHQRRAVNSIIKLTFRTCCFQMEDLNELSLLLLALMHFFIFFFLICSSKYTAADTNTLNKRALQEGFLWVHW